MNVDRTTPSVLRLRLCSGPASGRLRKGVQRGQGRLDRSVPTLLGCLITAALVASSPSAARTAPGPATSDATSHTPVATALSNPAARAIGRIVASDLALAPIVERRDYRIAALALEVAAAADPNDEAILRRLIEAQASYGDNERVLQLTGRLIQPDMAPNDTVAQLRLISGRIAAMQSVDERLAAYDNFLGPRGQSIDASIRSRLALDAALLLREQGDLKGFGRRLSESIGLDPTNADAAGLAAAFHAENLPEDLAGRLDLLLVLLKADPLDPESHIAIARLLASGGAYKGSRRFYETMQTIVTAGGLPADAGLMSELRLAAWNANGARDLLDKLRDSLEHSRRRVAQQREAAMREVGRIGPLPDPSAVQFDVGTARLLAAAASALGDDEATDWAIAELAASIATAISPPPPPVDRPGAPAPVQLTDKEKQQLQADLLWMRLLVNRQLAEGDAQLEELRKDPDVTSHALARFDGWRALRAGDTARARELLQPLAESDLLAELGVAVATEVDRDLAGAAERYGQFARRHSGTLVGAWARTRAATLNSGVEPPLPADAARLEAVAAGVPSWLESMVSDPRSFMAIHADAQPPVQTGRNPVETYPLRIRIRNASPIPLAMGSERPLNSRFLLTPSVEMGRYRVDDGGNMEVLSLDRRLRLMPQETLDVTLNVDGGHLWTKLELAGDRQTRIRWRLLQGFRISPSGIAIPGPHCLTSESGAITRLPPVMADATATQLLATVRNGTSEKLAQAIAGMAGRWPAYGGSLAFSSNDALALADALAVRYPGEDRNTRLLMVAMLPPSRRVTQLSAFDDAARAERDPSVLSLVLLTRVVDAADPLLADAERSAQSMSSRDEATRLAEMARLIKERLTELQRLVADNVIQRATSYSLLEARKPEDAAPSAGGEPSPAGAPSIPAPKP